MVPWFEDTKTSGSFHGPARHWADSGLVPPNHHGEAHIFFVLRYASVLIIVRVMEVRKRRLKARDLSADEVGCRFLYQVRQGFKTRPGCLESVDNPTVHRFVYRPRKGAMTQSTVDAFWNPAIAKNGYHALADNGQSLRPKMASEDGARSFIDTIKGRLWGSRQQKMSLVSTLR